MTARIFDGRPLFRQLQAKAAAAIAAAGVTPVVALLMVEGVEPLVGVNFRLHVTAMRDTGYTVRSIVLPEGADQFLMLATIAELNADDEVDAIMVLIPLPEAIDVRVVLAAIDPAKESEGLHPAHAARLSPLSTLPPTRLPVVPLATLTLLGEVGLSLPDHTVVIITDPEITEKNPIGKMVSRVAAAAALPSETAVCTVAITHPKVKELASTADLLVVSITRPRMVTADYVQPGAVVIDFNAIVDGWVPSAEDPLRLVPKLVGGVDVDAVAEVAAVLAPVPGGIGPTMLGTLILQIAGMAIARANLSQASLQPTGA